MIYILLMKSFVKHMFYCEFCQSVCVCMFSFYFLNWSWCSFGKQKFILLIFVVVDDEDDDDELTFYIQVKTLDL